MSQIVVRLAFGLANVERKDWLRTLQRLHLGLLIDGENDGILGRTHIKADDVPHLRDKLRIIRELERPRDMRFQAERPPDASDRRPAQARSLRHLLSAPVRLAFRLRLKRLDDNGLDLVVSHLLGRTHAWLIVESFQASIDEALSPLANRLVGRSMLASDGRVRGSVRAGEDQARSERDVAIYPASPRELLQLLPIVRRYDKLGFRSSCDTHQRG